MEIYKTITMMLMKGNVMISKGHKVLIAGTKMVDDLCMIIGTTLDTKESVELFIGRKEPVFILM